MYRGGGGGRDFQSDGGFTSELSSINSFTTGGGRSAATSHKMALVGDEIDITSPRLVNLNPDPLFSEALTYYLREGITMIGSNVEDCDIHLTGPGEISPHHCCIINSGDGNLTIYPFANHCTTYLNGQLISTSERCLVRDIPEDDDGDGGHSLHAAQASPLSLFPTTLHHGCRLIFGSRHYFRFDHAADCEVSPGSTQSAVQVLLHLTDMYMYS